MFSELANHFDYVLRGHPAILVYRLLGHPLSHRV